MPDFYRISVGISNFFTHKFLPPFTFQGSQGYSSAENDFLDMDGFPSVPDTSLPELNLQVDH